MRAFLLSLGVLFWPCASGAQNPERPDGIHTAAQRGLLELTWSDAEDTLKGTVRPDLPVEGEPFTVSLRVASFDGEPFAGPVTIGLRAPGENATHTVTVTPEAGIWTATLTPQARGTHTLTVGFRTTRHKQLRAFINVAASPLPRTLSLSLVALIALVLVGTTAWRLIRRDPSAPGRPASST